MGGSVSAQAEKRIFIIANNSDGYGIDRCLASGANCGVAVATAYCKSRDFSQAASFRKVDHDEITGAVPIMGPFLGRLLRGGDDVTGATLTPAVAAMLLFGTFFTLMIMRVPVAFAARCSPAKTWNSEPIPATVAVEPACARPSTTRATNSA